MRDRLFIKKAHLQKVAYGTHVLRSTKNSHCRWLVSQSFSSLPPPERLAISQEITSAANQMGWHVGLQNAVVAMLVKCALYFE